MRRKASRQGITLLEMLVYIALFAVVTGSAVVTFSHCWDNNKAIARDADDITRALELGERWRGDIRAATGPIEQASDNGVTQLRIPSLTGNIIYTISNGAIRRQPNAVAQASLWLANVKSSQVNSEKRGSATVWRWELELKTDRKEARFKPLFTFETAVPTTSLAP